MHNKGALFLGVGLGVAFSVGLGVLTYAAHLYRIENPEVMVVDGRGRVELLAHDGMFWGEGSVNGHTMKFLVDTGARYITLYENEPIEGITVYGKARLITANGETEGSLARIPKVRIGGIELRPVKAVLVRNRQGPLFLLGMSFLENLKWEHQPGKLILYPNN